jgi:hypothetical protein
VRGWDRVLFSRNIGTRETRAAAPEIPTIRGRRAARGFLLLFARAAKQCAARLFVVLDSYHALRHCGKSLGSDCSRRSLDQSSAAPAARDVPPHGCRERRAAFTFPEDGKRLVRRAHSPSGCLISSASSTSWRHFHRPAGALRSGELSGVRELAERRPVEELVVGIVHELHGRHGPRALLCCRAMPGGNAPVVPRADGGMLELSKDNLSRR